MTSQSSKNLGGCWYFLQYTPSVLIFQVWIAYLIFHNISHGLSTQFFQWRRHSRGSTSWGHLSQKLLVTFHHCSVESILTYGILVWPASCIVTDKKALQRVINSAQELCGSHLPSLEDTEILKPTSGHQHNQNPGNSLFTFFRFALPDFSIVFTQRSSLCYKTLKLRNIGNVHILQKCTANLLLYTCSTWKMNWLWSKVVQCMINNYNSKRKQYKIVILQSDSCILPILLIIVTLWLYLVILWLTSHLILLSTAPPIWRIVMTNNLS